MAVFRVERNKGYTVMSNHHLRNKELSLKAKGLLSLMLSLPEDWDYTLAGLSHINRESIDAIRTAVWELEKAGYITRRQERKRKETEMQSAFEIYEEIIKENISYDLLKQDMPYDCDRLDEIVDLILETVCTRRKTIRIAGDDYPAELVKAKFMKLDSEHIRFVLDCMQKNTTKIRNIKQYLRAVLFNAPSTIDNYYTSLVAHDMASGKI